MSAKKKSKKEIQGKTVLKSLEFKLTDEQKANKGLKAAELSEELKVLEIEKKKVTGEYTAKIKTKLSTMSTLLHEIHGGIENRDVECIEHMNFKAGKVEFYFEGEKKAEREMTPADRQLELIPLETKKKSKAEMKRNSIMSMGEIILDEEGQQEAPDDFNQDTDDQEFAALNETEKEIIKDRDMKQIFRRETNKKTKKSAIDGRSH